MSVTIIVGINWGDEGKGKMVDYLAQRADVVVRYQGGNNAGHTVVNEHGKFKMHLIPSGVFNPKVINLLGPGMVIDLEGLADEIASLKAAGIDHDNIRVSDRATICFPFHRQEDGWEEERLGKAAYGSTKRGIAPSYGDRALKKAIQVGELLYPDVLTQRLRDLVAWKNLVCTRVYGADKTVRFEETLEWTLRYGAVVRPLIVDALGLLRAAQDAGKKILFEAQLGALRDVSFGIYPFTSSSCCLAAFAPIGGGLFGVAPRRVIGVMKAFSTCVGAGPFVTEMDEKSAGELREIAFEYGAATGRPRRIGYFDAVASRYGVRVQGATEVALTKLDSLSGRKTIPVCTHYEVDGRRLDDFPLNPLLDRAKPVYAELAGWSQDITGCRKFSRLPQAARRYVLTLEKLVGCPIRYVSVGPERDSLIDRRA